MICPKCRSEIPDGSRFCPQCGTTLISPEAGRDILKSKKKDSGLAISAMILGILGWMTLCIGIGLVFGLIALILGIIAAFKIRKQREKYQGMGFAITGMITGGLLVLLIPFIAVLAAILIPNFKAAQERSKTVRVKAELQSIAVALEAYYIDWASYPSPQYDSDENTVLTSAITTPVAYISCMTDDIFNQKGEGRYQYYTDNSTQWIVTSYGPDKKDGNSGIPGGKALIEEEAISDDILGYPLESSGLTYDPTNGTTSGGDLWRRGP